jgi:C-terminal processing protease CtpA/Prc
MRQNKSMILLITLTLISLCPIHLSFAQTEVTNGLSSEARDYLNRALDIIQKSSVKRETRWDEFRRLTVEKAGNAKTPADTYAAIRDALQRLGDNHSGLFTPEDLKALETGRVATRKDIGIRVKDLVVITVFPESSASRSTIAVRDKLLAIDGTPLSTDAEYQKILGEARKKGIKGVELKVQKGKGEPQIIQLEFGEYNLNPPVRGRLVGTDIGLIELPQFAASLSDQQKAKEAADRFAEQIQTLIRELDREGVRGWILDLRLNNGGNMWPMLAGVGPILGEGEVGSFVSSSGATKWSYRDGKSMVNNNVITQVIIPYKLKRENPPVAVLTDEITASSAEAVLIAFKGRAKTHVFGMPTRGVPTANQPFKLSDGAVLNLTIAIEADRTGKTYDKKIPPDTEIKTDWSLYGTDEDTVIQAALKWLKNQGS